MAPWLQTVDEHHPLWDQLYGFCAKHGKKPNGAGRISILPTEAQDGEKSAPSNPKHLADLLVAVVKTLPMEERQEVKRRLMKA